MTHLVLTTLKRTQEIARQLALLARPRDVITFKGDLGAGKTEFARAFIRALMNDSIVVPSPTFTLVEVYEASVAPIWHFDLYRIKSSNEIWDLGIEEALAQGISLIEWPERLEESLHFKDYLELVFHLNDMTSPRKLTLLPHGNWIKRLQEEKFSA